MSYVAARPCSVHYIEADYARCEGRSIGGIRFDGLFSQSEWREHRCSVIALVEFYIAILGHQASSLRLGYFAKRSVDLASMGSFAARLEIIAAASLHRWTTITLHTGTSSFGGIGFDGVLSRNGRFKPLRSANTPYSPYSSDGTSRVGGQSTLAPDVYQHDVYQHEAAILILAGSKLGSHLGPYKRVICGLTICHGRTQLAACHEQTQ